MLDYFFFIFCFFSAINIQIKGLDNFFLDYLELDNTNSIKGLFVWLIIFRHKTAYGNYNKYLFKKIDNNLRQQIVSMFLFYSGFGIYESLKKKGIYYAKTLFSKGIIIFIKSQIIILLYLVANLFIINRKISFKRYLEAVIFKSGIGNSNWFAFTIIMFYFYSYISFTVVKTKLFYGIIFVNFFCILHSFLAYYFYFPNKKYSVDTILCFVIGFYYSLLKKHIDKIIMKNDIFYFGIISIIIFIYYEFYDITSLIKESIKNALFSILIVLISMKVKLNNDLLKFLNFHSYSIYLLQRLVMMIVTYKKIFHNYNFIKISFEFSSIFFIASLFDRYTAFIDKLLKYKPNFIIKNNNKYIFYK